MTEHKRSKRNGVLESGVEELHLENGHGGDEVGTEIKEEATNSYASSPRDSTMQSTSQSPVKMDVPTQSPLTGSEKHEEVVGGEVTLKLEPGHPPKLARSSSQRVISKPPPLFRDQLSKTEEAKKTFQVLEQCSYTSKYIGSTEHGSMDCDCAEEWGKPTVPCDCVHAIILNTRHRQFHKDQFSMWAGFRLHQSCDEDGMFR